ncbi:MAG: hypothetical protein OEV17_10410, partial [Nitrospira sp.]|nr:hypothetical protein [Nitrospira sp.]
MASKMQAKKMPAAKSKSARADHGKSKPAAAAVVVKPAPPAVSVKPAPEAVVPEPVLRPNETAKEREARERRQEILHKMLLTKRHEIIKEIEESLGQSLT